ncbi:MAG: hypothetical protein BIP78_0171 [Candidatus Bipolaricaulis sibiricus]|uniref:Uncharacterized protein n=1 Tax=Bipolaricaulis sibiricus TaxID=2501609 RepID=A0A410FRU2_BIPS1|nr:MAG: hypothetical protein BIP78_0171 [Candidatus Bipolaricaulis sibiricus]
MSVTNHERIGRTPAYNALVQSWPEILRLARTGSGERAETRTMFSEEEV